MPQTLLPTHRTSRTRRQRGVIMIIALITLAIMLIGAVAAMRSMSSSLTGIGNFGFKRDMTNQAERAIRLVADQLFTGALSGTTARNTTSTALNYSASILPTNAAGIPNALLDASNLDTVGGAGVAANVIDLSGTGTDQGTKIHYVIDRLCLNTGALATDTCQTVSTTVQSGPQPDPLTAPAQPVFRVSIRVSGPRGAQSFYQAIFTAL